MKNKKPKTIEEILLHNIEFGAKNKKVWVSKIVPQIKQLIADEVVGGDEEPIIQKYLGNLKFDTTEFYNAIAINKLKRQQRKNLERL